MYERLITLFAPLTLLILRPFLYGKAAKAVVFFLLGLLLPIQVWAASIDSVRLWRAPDHTRVVLDMSSTVKYSIFQLDNPSRLVVDIKQSNNRAALKNIDYKNTPIKGIRAAARKQTDLRLVFDLNSSVKPRSFLLDANKSKPHRLVIDLYDKNTGTKKTLSNTNGSNNAASSTNSSNSNTIAAADVGSTKRDIIVVVDAGHGGEDPGAIGPKRVKEKVVVLDIAKKLAKRINNQQGYRAVLTRTGDYFLPLRKRRDIARKQRADLFISIHADAFTNPQARGASVFALSQRGATSETARFLAQQENEADLIGGVGDVSLDDKDEVLRGVLVDLSMTATVGSSLDVGRHVLKDMSGIAHLHKKHVEQAGFLVLKSPDVPSILVETGFISNPGEAKKLSSPSYRQTMANSLFKGIEKYFRLKPPAGTFVAWVKAGRPKPVIAATKPKSTPKTQPVSEPKKVASANGKDKTAPASSSSASFSAVPTPSVNPQGTITHKVTSGESLSLIAQRYRVSMTKLKRLNKLKNDGVRIGQVLTIAENVKPVDSGYAVIHRVENGDTLSEIAVRYKTSINAIRRLNKMSALSVIRIGQKIKIPHQQG